MTGMNHELIVVASRTALCRMYRLKSGTVALKEERVVTLAIMRAEAVMQLQQQQQSLFQTARIEVNAELLVQVCGNRRSQDVYVISPFFRMHLR